MTAAQQTQSAPEPVRAADYEDLRQRLVEVERKQAAADKQHAEDATVLARIEAQIPFLATKAELADFRTEALTAIANLVTQIAKMETQNERNSKNSIKWIVGTGVALAGVLVAAIGVMAGVILAALPS